MTTNPWSASGPETWNTTRGTWARDAGSDGRYGAIGGDIWKPALARAGVTGATVPSPADDAFCIGVGSGWPPPAGSAWEPPPQPASVSTAHMAAAIARDRVIPGAMSATGRQAGGSADDPRS